MASNTNIDIENATQHLRDILKLDRPGTGTGTDGLSADSRRTSFNGDLNGLFSADVIGVEVAVASAESTSRTAASMNTRERQIIRLAGDDNSCLVITSADVEIVASYDSCISSKARGSSKVKIQPMTNYDWEHKYYCGNLIAVSNSYLAYVIRGANSSAMVRVLSLGTAGRTLMKGFTGVVTDLAFAHLDSNQLACVDELGDLFVWQLISCRGKIRHKLIVHVRRPSDTPLYPSRRVIWCPFVPEENEESPEEACQMLALLHADRAEVWDLDILTANHSSFPVDSEDLKDSFVTVRGHQAPISEGCLSPDGTVLATASQDGYIKFWQIYIEGPDLPRCLHEWKPHNGKPLSCLLFCDNHKKQDPEVPFWRFLITGADQNRELKIWCTVYWTCLQTVRFSPDPYNSSVMPSLKASLDLSAAYLILSDVQRKVLYVMELAQDQERGHAGFAAVSEFLLTHPVLSFGIQDVSWTRMRLTEVLPPEEDNENTTGEATHGPLEAKTGVQIKLYCIHTKSLQDVQIWFQPHLAPGNSLFPPHANSQANFGYTDHVVEESPEGLCADKGPGCGSQNDLHRISTLPAPAGFLSPAGSESRPKLMTPDAFMTPSASIPASPGSSTNSLTLVAATSSPCARAAEDQSPKVPLESGSSLMLNSPASGGAALPPSPHSSILLMPGLSDQLPGNNIQANPPPSPPPSLDLRSVEPLLVLQASPTRARSPDVISSASAVVPQDMPEITSEMRPWEPAIHGDRMASAVSALHALSPRGRDGPEHSIRALQTGMAAGGPEAERLSATPLLLEAAVIQGVTGAAVDRGAGQCQPWPSAPDITRETRGSLRDIDLAECSQAEKMPKVSPYQIRSYSMSQNDSQDASAEQSDHDDEVTSLASSPGNCDSSSMHRQGKDWKVSPRGSPKLKRKTKKDDGDRQNDLQGRLREPLPSAQVSMDVREELLLLLRSQQREVAELRQNQAELLQSVTAHADTIHGSIVGHVKQVMAVQQEQDHDTSEQRMEHLVLAGQEQNQQLQAHLSEQLGHALSSTLSAHLDRLLRDEIRRAMAQTVSKSLESVMGQLNTSIGAKLTAVEGTLKENVAKVAKSKSTTDAIGRTAAEAVQGPIQAAYKEAFQGTVLPIFEKGCQSMFLQIDDSFREGTQEYIQQLESHARSRRRRNPDDWDPALGQLQHVIDALQMCTEQLVAAVTAGIRSEVQRQLHVLMGNLQDSILVQVQRAVKGEVSLAMREQQAAVTSSIIQAMRSTAGTPVPSAHVDYQAQQATILQLLQQGQVNQAFQQALSAADLNLVLYVCETVDSQRVFGQHPCPLIQPVLLSLIQQLSTNLATRSELKIGYLEDALINLDHSDPVMRDHMSSVLVQVRQKLFQFLQQEPQGTLTMRARRLLLMLQGLASR